MEAKDEMKCSLFLDVCNKHWSIFKNSWESNFKISLIGVKNLKSMQFFLTFSMNFWKISCPKSANVRAKCYGISC